MSAETVLVFGASQRTGLEVTRLLRARGDAVRAFVRPTTDRTGLEPLGVDYAVGDVLDSESVAAAFAQGPVSAAICTFGGARGEPRPDLDGMVNVIEAAKACDVTRVILITGIGAGDSRGAISDNVWKFLGPVLSLKGEAEASLTASGLKWTILRPGGMGSEPATGTAVKTEDHSVMGMIQRADLAALVIDCLDDDNTIGKIYHTIDPESKEVPPLQRGEQLKVGAPKP